MFKNALCMVAIPQSYVPDYWFCCHRHKDHPGPHRAKGRWEWNDGDEEVAYLSRPGDKEEGK